MTMGDVNSAAQPAANPTANIPPRPSPPATAGSGRTGATPPRPVTGNGEANGSSRPAVDCTNSGGAESQAHRQPPRKRQQSEARSSRYRGVQWDRNGARWRARLHTDRTRHIGYYAEEDEAAMAWDLAVLRYYGESEGIKKLNFGEESIRRYRQELMSGPNVARPEGAGMGVMGGQVNAYRGVFAQEGGMFRAVVLKNRMHVPVGVFSTSEEAARAYDRAAIEAFGWGALTNFPISDYNTQGGARTGAHQQQQQQGQQLLQFQQQQQQQQGQQGQLPPRPPMHRQSSAPLPYDTAATPMHMIRSASQTSMDVSLSGMPSRQASLPNIQLLQTGHHHQYQGSASTPWPVNGILSSLSPFQAAQTMLTNTPAGQPQLVYYTAANTGGVPAPETAAQMDTRKRLRSEDLPHRGAAVVGHAQNGHQDTGAPNAAAAGGCSDSQGMHTSADEHGSGAQAFSGVRQETDGSGYRAMFTVDLGTFKTAELAKRAYDRAALMNLGLLGCTHGHLPDIMAAAAAAAPQVPPGTPAGLQGITLLRCGSYVVSLEIAGTKYDMGPFATELDAAKAYDKYSILLHGVRGATNLPPWEALASRQEVSSLVGAMLSGNAPTATQPQAPQLQLHQPQSHQQQQHTRNINGASGSLPPLSSLPRAASSQDIMDSQLQARLASNELEQLQAQLSDLQAQAALQKQQLQAREGHFPVLLHTHSSQNLQNMQNVQTLQGMHILQQQNNPQPSLGQFLVAPVSQHQQQQYQVQQQNGMPQVFTLPTNSSLAADSGAPRLTHIPSLQRISSTANMAALPTMSSLPPMTLTPALPATTSQMQPEQTHSLPTGATSAADAAMAAAAQLGQQLGDSTAMGTAQAQPQAPTQSLVVPAHSHAVLPHGMPSHVTNTSSLEPEATLGTPESGGAPAPTPALPASTQAPSRCGASPTPPQSVLVHHTNQDTSMVAEAETGLKAAPSVSTGGSELKSWPVATGAADEAVAT